MTALLAGEDSKEAAEGTDDVTAAIKSLEVKSEVVKESDVKHADA